MRVDTLLIHGAVLLAAFGAALGYGTLLPLLPAYLATVGSNDAEWHMGVLPVLFLASASVFAPLWGRLSDTSQRRRVLAGGLVVMILAPLPFYLHHSIAALYAYQALAGIAFGGVITVALAMAYEFAPSGQRARSVAWLGTATLAGYLAGPALGGWIDAVLDKTDAHRMVDVALAGQVAFPIVALGLMMPALIAHVPVLFRDTARSPESNPRSRIITMTAALLTAFMIGAFEIAALFYVRSPFHLASADTALIFISCSAAMIVAQLVLLPRLAMSDQRPRIAMTCIIASGILMALLALAQSHVTLLMVSTLQGVSLGLAVGLLSFESAATGGPDRGVLLGYQNAAVNAGQAAGSAAGASGFIAFGTAAIPALGVLVIIAASLLRRAHRVWMQPKSNL